MLLTPGTEPSAFADDFDGPELNPSVWFPHYLPAWSSRADTAAGYRVADSQLTLELLPGEGFWCRDTHRPPLRISGIQTGNGSGPVGSTCGQQPFLPDQQVVEQQPRFEGLLQTSGTIEIRCRMQLSARSMAAFWLVGFEDEPARCGEICVTEVFGRAVDPGRSAEIGMGIHRFRDPALTEDFAAPRLLIDVTEHHVYGVSWTDEGAVFTVDGAEVRRCERPPTYPLQLMLAVFDFPDWSDGTDDDLVPRLDVDWIRARC